MGAGMNIDFNNVRKQAMFAYEELCEKLNDSIIKNDDQHGEPNALRGYPNNYVSLKGYVLIDAEDIQKQMDSLRSMIGAIAMTHEEGSEEFKDVYEEEYPLESDKRLPSFNDDNEE